MVITIFATAVLLMVEVSILFRIAEMICTDGGGSGGGGEGVSDTGNDDGVF